MSDSAATGAAPAAAPAVELSSLGVPELRRKCREAAQAASRETSAIATWNKGDCIAFLERGIWPGAGAATGAVPAIPGAGADPVALMAAAMRAMLPTSGNIDEAKVRAIVAETMADYATRIEVTVPGKPKVDVGVQHKCFPLLLKTIGVGQHAYLCGPAGSSKTTAAHQAAKALGRTFYCQSVGQQTSKSDLLGYMSATGTYVRTHLREAYEHGGVFLLDECDAGNANVLTVLNALLANGHCAFPDAMVERHESFVCIAAANTYGTGADRVYVGRNQLDGASLDRFAFIDWPYDTKLERHLAGDQTEWAEYVWSVRKAVLALKLRHVVSTRAIIHGAKLLAAGIARDTVEDMVLWKGLDADQRSKVAERLRAEG